MSGSTLDPQILDGSSAMDSPRGLGEMARGILVMLGASLALVVVAFIVMQAVAGPNGWATRVAATAYTTEAVLVSGPLPVGMAD